MYLELSKIPTFYKIFNIMKDSYILHILSHRWLPNSVVKHLILIAVFKVLFFTDLESYLGIYLEVLRTYKFRG